MTLPLKIPYEPMEALNVDEIPSGDVWQYEPKWDGFRCLAFRDGDNVQLQSRSGKPLARYFPEIVAGISAFGADRFVLDGEIILPVGDLISFEELQQRLHPAESRVRKLAAERPALFVAFDFLVDEHATLLVQQPLSERRAALEHFAESFIGVDETVRLSPVTREVDVAREWLHDMHGGLDGVIAKRLDCEYRTGERDGMQKIKRMRTADCVVGGFRYGTKDRLVGSLLLGLYDDDGLLHHIGYTSGIRAADKPALTAKLEALRTDPGFSGRSPGGQSRWSTERSGDWEALKPELVVEVQYDHYSEGRFRHGTRLVRWRPDKEARQCTMDQIQPAGSTALKMLGFQ